MRIRAPQGARIALASEGSFTEPQPGDALVGMQIGGVYRLQVTTIQNNPGVEIFPTVEVIDRLYPPPGRALRYPIPIELSADELDMAAQGVFVTRVIYVEDPDQALPVRRSPDESQPWIEARPGDDPLVVADALGRPVAILRIGGRVPSAAGPDGKFTFGCPPLMIYDANAVPGIQPQALPTSSPNLQPQASRSDDRSAARPAAYYNPSR